MIVRSWKGATAVADADEYQTFLRAEILPELEEIAGSRGAYVLRRDDGDRSEFLFLSLWDSMEAILRFAGPDPERAVIRPEAERLLVELDRQATHYQVVDSWFPPGPGV